MNKSVEEFESLLPNKPWASDTKGYAKVYPKDKAKDLPYISPNFPLINYLIFDIDIITEDISFPAIIPTLQVTDKDKRTHHNYYQLSRPIPREMSYKTKLMLDTTLKGMKLDLNADTVLTGPRQLSKNPLSKVWVVTASGIKYQLIELLDGVRYSLESISSSYSAKYEVAHQDILSISEQYPDSRNCCLFHYGRKIAYNMVRKKYSKEVIFNFLLDELGDRNAQDIPILYSKKELPYSEIRSIARSISEWCYRNRNRIKSWSRDINRGAMGFEPMRDLVKEEYILTLKERQRLSAERTSKVKKERSEKLIIDAIYQTKQEGKKITLIDLSRRTGLSYCTIKNYSTFIKQFTCI